MRFRPWIWLSVLCFSSALFAASTPPNIVLITIDTARADRMGFLGSIQGLTPNLDELAKQSVVYTHAYSQVPLTTASHATILTGTYPQFHKVNDAGVPLSAQVPYGPAVLRARGYQTAAFVGAVILDPKGGGAPGFDRAFTIYNAGFRNRGPGEERYRTLERRANDVVTRAVEWMKKRKAGPFFLWVHVYDPHAPYDPPEPYRSRYSSDLYNGEIAYTDAALGKLLEALKADKLFDGAAIAVMGDHGEALGEHGERGHGVFLYDSTIHVPLVLKLPANRSAGKRVESRASLVDVMPTLLASAGISPPAAMQGRSLLGRLSSDVNDEQTYAETDYPHKAFGWSSLRSLRSGKYLFVEAPRKELYDEASDPGEEHNLAGNATAVSGTLEGKLREFRQRTASASRGRSGVIDPDQAQKLSALGYVASSSAGKEGEVSGIDPKDRIEVANLITEANLATEEGLNQEAIQKLQRAVKMDSGFAAGYSVLGSTLMAMGNAQDAAAALRKAIELQPTSVMAHYQLGLAMFQLGDLNAAAPQFEAAVAGDRSSATMHYSLASVYVRQNRMEDAKRELKRALQLKPEMYLANVMLGQVFIVQKQPAMALPFLKSAEKGSPSSAEGHALLANVYGQLGQKSQADRERELARGSR
jgi:choline-sulfatase